MITGRGRKPAPAPEPVPCGCAERLADYWVLVSDTPFTSDSLEEARTAPGVTAVHREDRAGRPTNVDLAGAKGRYVRVQLASTTAPLSLTEVVVRAREDTA